eukprot:symbB.v1.2.020167.t1/scaffold1649.1/size108312/10
MAPCEQARQWKKAFTMLSDVIEVGLQPDINTFGIVMGSLQTLRQWVHSMQLMKQVHSARLDINEVHAGSTIASAQASKHWRLACHLVLDAGRMRLYFREPAFGAALEACSTFWWATLALAEEMSSQSLLPTVPLLVVKSNALELGRSWLGQSAVLDMASFQGLHGLAIRKSSEGYARWIL